MKRVPAIRISACNKAPKRKDGAYILYWMIANRRLQENFALQRAVELANEHGVGLLIFEPLRIGYRWASDRIHRFIIDGMCDHYHHFEDAKRANKARYYPYLELEANQGKGALEALATNAVMVVTDEFPCFFLPMMVDAAAKKLDVRLEQVDSNGLLPLRAAPKTYTTAYSFRRGLHKILPDHLEAFPEIDPLAELEKDFDDDWLPEGFKKKWPTASEAMLAHGAREPLAELDIDHDVAPVPFRGGAVAALDRMETFLDEKLAAYPEDRNKPSEQGASGLSPYLHFGHIGVHTIFRELTEREGWSPSDIATKPTGKREGWWNMSEGAESFVDELITWREIGYNMAHREPDTYDKYESLPDWAKETLAIHVEDERKYVYTLEEFENAETHDELWNAAQRQLVQEGHIQNYLRMLWGKKILHWTSNAQDALEIMIELNNKYGIDGRNPNSYSGIFWTLGRYDRGWTERDIFGKVRYMTSDSTRRKYKVEDYIARYS